MRTKVNGNPWLNIGVRPRDTIRNIVATNPKYGFLALCAFNGFPMALSFAQSISLGLTLPTWALVIGALLVCGFLGFISISISSALLLWTGRWLGGTGNYSTIRAAVAWSNVPNFITSLTWLALLAIFGGLVLNQGFSETTFVGYQAGAVFLIFLIQSIVSIWGFIILLKALGEVQGFSVWRALLNVIIPFVIVVVVVWLVGWVIWGTSSIVK